MRTLYTILTCDDPDELSDQVNEAFTDGWVLQGGVSSTISTMKGNSSEYGEHDFWVTVTYAQAMTKQMPEEEYARLQAEMDKEMASDSI